MTRHSFSISLISLLTFSEDEIEHLLDTFGTPTSRTRFYNTSFFLTSCGFEKSRRQEGNDGTRQQCLHNANFLFRGQDERTCRSLL